MIEPARVNSCKMMTPTCAFVTGTSSRQQPIALPPSFVTANRTPSVSNGSKRRTEYVDPCQIAPLKKRKIQVSLRKKPIHCPKIVFIQLTMYNVVVKFL